MLSIHSVWDIFSILRIDNNHPLVSVYLYFLGLRPQWFHYHLLSLLTGVGTVLVLWRIAAAGGYLYAKIVLVLASFSFVLVNYSSEARGYAPAAFFCLIAYHELSKFVQNKSWKAATLYTLAGMLSVLSSLTSVIVLVSLACWSFWELLTKHPFKRAVRDCLVVHASLCIFLLGYYHFFVSKLFIAGGSDFTYQHVILKFMSFSFGVQGDILLEVIASIFFVALYFCGLHFLYKRKKYSRIVLNVFIFPLVPILILLLMNPQFLYIRYFFVCLPFLLLLWGDVLANIYNRRAAGRLFSIAILCCYVAGNLWGFVFFVNNGERGQYIEALQYMQSISSKEERITVSSDHDLRNGLVVRFYASMIPDGSKITYISRGKIQTPPLWYIEHHFETSEERTRTQISRFGAHYRLDRVFPYGQLSGFSWSLYRKE